MTSADQRSRVLYVALDGCDADIMMRLAHEGRCPSFAALLDEGAVHDTTAPSGTFVSSSWMTIMTGTDVGTHRYWNWLEIDQDTYHLRETSPREARGRPFWEQLSESGRRSAVLDVPHSEVPAEFNGLFLKEWGCHDRHHGTASFPESLLAELDESIGCHPLGSRTHAGGASQFAPCDYTLRDGPVRTFDEERHLLDLLRAGIDAKHRASKEILEREPWDFFATVLGEGHCVGHQLWHVHDRSHPRHDPATSDVLGDPVEDIYIRLDAVLGDLVGRVGRDANVYVQLNHGMGPHYDGEHLLDALLVRFDQSLMGGFEPGSWSRIGTRVYRRTPTGLRATARRGIAAAARFKASVGAPVPAVRAGPHPDRRFFAMPGNTTVGAIRFNIVGRESAGIVDPGTELDELIDALTRGLHDVVDIDSGRSLVRRVIRADSVIEKHADDRLPDLFVEWERATLVERVWSPETGTVAAPYSHWRTGDHHDRGVFVARGPGIEPGRRTAPMSLADVAPTLAAAVGVELVDIDGRPRWDLVGDAGTRSVRAEATARRFDDLDAQASDLRERFDTELSEVRRRLAVGERERLISTTMRLLAQLPISDDTLISVITPTHARPERLAEAIRSVVAQRHECWEMVIVDDGSNSAAKVVAEFGDDRISLVEVDHGGASRARNTALDLAAGDVIVYLDDDNRLDPGWLHAVAWAFREHQDASVLYGARVFDDFLRAHGRAECGWPFLHFEVFDRPGLEQNNMADMGVIAHRARLNSRFQEDLSELGDWDFFLSLTENETPLELPAIALYYRTDGTDRLTGTQPGEVEVIRRKWAARRAGDDARRRD